MAVKSWGISSYCFADLFSVGSAWLDSVSKIPLDLLTLIILCITLLISFIARFILFA